jgi:O-antigen ligase
MLAARRGRLAAVTGIAALLVVTVGAAAGGSGAVAGNSNLARLTSLASPSELESSSTIEGRLEENRFALEAIGDSPFFGIGWGVPYGLTEIHYIDGQYVTQKQLYLHQQYLNLWLRAGLIGLIGLLAALVLSVRYGAGWLRRPGDDAWIGGGVVAATTAIALSSLVGIYILNPASAPVLAGLFALATCLQREMTAR